MQNGLTGNADLFGLAGAEIKGAIFDLDGVLVDTAKYHYLAWKRLAREYGFDFTEEENERLKGVSRMRSLEILLAIGKITLSKTQMEAAAAAKNAWYVEHLFSMDDTAILPGSKEYLARLRDAGIPLALGSTSKNAQFILDRLNIAGFFDAVLDGNYVIRGKPDPLIFLKAAAALGVSPKNCVVFEDALAGVEAAKAGFMRVIAVGAKESLPGADRYVNSLADMQAKA
ncbi:MAG: beta-phosphoglucomutase [Treponema sp.]|nr:beta-phosphoglucomutase [Treponema sp.]